MPAQLFAIKALDQNGSPVASAEFNSWVAGTTIRQAVYDDEDLLVPLPNPVVSNSDGILSLWLDTSKTYKFNLTFPTAQGGAEILPTIDNFVPNSSDIFQIIGSEISTSVAAAESARDAAQAASTAAAASQTAASSSQTAAANSATTAGNEANNAATNAALAAGSATAAAASATDAATSATAAAGSATTAASSASAAQTSQQTASSAATTAGLARDHSEEWANKAEDSLVSAAAGGDEVDDYSAKHFSIKSAASRAAADDASIAASLAEVNFSDRWLPGGPYVDAAAAVAAVPSALVNALYLHTSGALHRLTNVSSGTEASVVVNSTIADISDVPGVTATGQSVAEAASAAAARTAISAQETLANISGVPGVTATGQSVAEAASTAALRSIVGLEPLANIAALTAESVSGLSNFEARLVDGARGGVFVWDSSDLSTEVGYETSGNVGVFYAPDSDPTGASGAWVRLSYITERTIYVDHCDAGAENQAIDDAPAFEAALKLAASLSSGSVLIGTGAYASRSIVPVKAHGGKTYYWNSTIDFTGNFHSIRLSCDGLATIQSTSSNTRTVTGLQADKLRKLWVDGFEFSNFDTIFEICTNNVDLSEWTFSRCTFANSNLGLDTKSYWLSRSTVVRFVDCICQYSMVQWIKGFTDHLILRGCWIGSGSTSTKLIEVNSFVHASGCIWIPAQTAAVGRCFIYLTDADGDGQRVTQYDQTVNYGGAAVGELPVAGFGTIAAQEISVTTNTQDENRGVVIEGGRVSAESGNHPLVVCDFSIPKDELRNNPIISIKDCPIGASHAQPFATGNTDCGIVYLIRYPGAIKFSGCSVYSVGAARAKMVAIDDGLGASPHDDFQIEMDEVTLSAARVSLGANASHTPVSASLINYLYGFGSRAITPTITGTTTDPTAYSGAGRWTLINGWVHFQCKVVLTTKGSLSGVVEINLVGAPRAHPSSAQLSVFPVSSVSVTFSDTLHGVITANTTTMQLFRSITGASRAVLTDTGVVDGSTFYFSGSYLADPYYFN